MNLQDARYHLDRAEKALRSQGLDWLAARVRIVRSNVEACIAEERGQAAPESPGPYKDFAP